MLSWLYQMTRAQFLQRSVRFRADAAPVVDPDILIPATDAKFVRVYRVGRDAI